uniref:uncharacterized protein LOC124060169 n=1 Tax=Scatophagus argus TaxID=75038 RepID=UPI001ED8282F|nr:uncharacterized protein LOC124060169 [Scatophagus argus]
MFRGERIVVYKMEELHESVMSDDKAAETVQEKENNSGVTMDQPQTPASGCEPTAGAENENQLQVFVTVLTVRVLNKCNAVTNHNQEEWVAHIKRLVNQTMEGLTVTEGFCPDIKSTKKVCKAVMKELQKKFGSRRVLETLMLLEDPVVEAEVVRCLQAHIKDLSARLAKKAANSGKWWIDMLKVMAITAGFLAALVLLILIP